MFHPALRPAVIVCTGCLLLVGVGCEPQPQATDEPGWLLEDHSAAQKPMEGEKQAQKEAEQGEAKQADSEKADQPAEAQAEQKQMQARADTQADAKMADAKKEASAKQMKGEAEAPASEPKAMAEKSDEGSAEPTGMKPAEVKARMQKIQGSILLKPVGGILAEAMIARREAGKPLPKDYKSPEFVISVIESLRLQHPGLFEVSEAEKKRYKAGEFEDRANLRRVRQALAEVQRRDLPLSTLSNYLAQQYHSGELKGLRLVLAARLLEAEVSTALPGTAQGAE